jgi:integrase
MAPRQPRRRDHRGYIEQLRSGSYRAVVPAGTDLLTGRRRPLRETCKTLDEAKAALTKLQRQVDEQQHPKSSVTLGEAIEQWLDVAELEVTTRERYEDLIRLYIAPRMGAQQAAKIDAELLERFYARLHRCRDLCGGRPPKGHVCRPLSTSTTRKIHYIIRGALGNAVRWRYLSVNPAELANAPSPRKTKPDPPSATEAAALLAEAWSDPEWGLLLWLTMVTGCRRGELCSLRWRHIDEARAYMWVQRSTAQPTRAKAFEKDTKTETERRISLDPQTMVLLADHKARAAAQCARLGLELDEEAFIFSAAPDYSTSLLPRSVTQRYRRMAARLKLRSTRLLSRPGARCRCCHRSVSPDRSPNPPYRSLGNGLSTVSAVRRGSWLARELGSCCPGRCSARPSPSRSGRTRPRSPRSATARWRRSSGGVAAPIASHVVPSACGRASRT